MTAEPTTLPLNQQRLEALIDNLLERHHHRLPDLGRIAVIVPQASLTPRLRLELLRGLERRGNHRGVIPPFIGTLRDWVSQSFPPAHARTCLTNRERALLFIEAMKAVPDSVRQENQWPMTDALLSLFDELTLENTDLDRFDDWQQRIARGYGLEQHPHCTEEAKTLFNLWHAWQQQCAEMAVIDAATDYTGRLATARQWLLDEKPLPAAFLVVVGDSPYAKSEKRLLTALEAAGRLQRMSMSNDATQPPTPYAGYIEQVFPESHETAATVRQRIADCERYRDIRPPYSCFLANSEENQVEAIDCRIRLWLLDGKRDIGVVCEDRKLARRLRALLDRANVTMQDHSGWSLATTQAATILERWLQCVEEDFDAQALIDCLTSPFTRLPLTVVPDEALDYLVHRFEQDIVIAENTHSDLQRYRQALNDFRQKNRRPQFADIHLALDTLLAELEDIASPLVTLCRNGKPEPAASYLKTFSKTLERLGVFECYREDAAGLRLLQTLEEMASATAVANPKLHWQDFRLWLSRSLEDSLFSPQDQDSVVKLMTLDQADYHSFDALIIAAVEPQHFPGKPDSSPFFNQSVRESLGLRCHETVYPCRLAQFKRLLFAAPSILLTARSEEAGDSIAVSPWLELLMTFHQQVFKQPAIDPLPGQLLADGQCQVRNDDAPLPAPTGPSAARLPNALIPETFSASSHQRLIDCPYRFFCADALGLNAWERDTQELGKSDFGERVHLILHLFHGTGESGERCRKKNSRAFDIPPFPAVVTPHNRRQAIAHLEALSRQVFQKDIDANALHRSWLQRWLKQVPAYIDWQIRQHRHWRVITTEHDLHCELPQAHRLIGRIDRIDGRQGDDPHARGQQCIIDYKTGHCPSQHQVKSGENVQLTSYALLAPEATTVKFVKLDESGKVIDGASLQDDELASLRTQTRQRLTALIEALHDGEALPAWGDRQTCQYCRFSGICRKPFRDAAP